MLLVVIGIMQSYKAPTMEIKWTNGNCNVNWVEAQVCGLRKWVNGGAIGITIYLAGIISCKYPHDPQFRA